MDQSTLGLEGRGGGYKLGFTGGRFEMTHPNGEWVGVGWWLGVNFFFWVGGGCGGDRHARHAVFRFFLRGNGWRCRLQKLEDRNVLQNHRSGTSIYRKKIDTQKVYVGHGVERHMENRLGKGGARRKKQ